MPESPRSSPKRPSPQYRHDKPKNLAVVRVGGNDGLGTRFKWNL